MQTKIVSSESIHTASKLKDLDYNEAIRFALRIYLQKKLDEAKIDSRRKVILRETRVLVGALKYKKTYSQLARKQGLSKTRISVQCHRFHRFLKKLTEKKNFLLPVYTQPTLFRKLRKARKCDFCRNYYPEWSSWISTTKEDEEILCEGTLKVKTTIISKFYRRNFCECNPE